MVVSLAGGREGKGNALGSAELEKELLQWKGFEARKVEVVRRSGDDHKEATKAEPHWTLATPHGDAALCPAVVEARKWMEPRE